MRGVLPSKAIRSALSEPETASPVGSQRLNAARAELGAAGKGKEESSPGLKPGFRHMLYDLSKDPAEQTDLAAKQPAELKRLHELMENVIASGASRMIK